MPRRRAVVTGIGVVNPAGLGKERFWEAVAAGRSALGPITRFDTRGYPVSVAAEVKGFVTSDFVPRRFAVKTDRFTHYALAAGDMALSDAALDLEREDRGRVGVWFGNNAGGWDICERGFRELYRDGARMVNPWQATAWFPTAPQGYLTIRYGIKGCSKSFVCDRASGASALYFAERAVRLGHNDVVLTGGTEAPLTGFGVTCYYETGELSPARDAAAAHRPFDRRRDGLILGEGSTVLVVEELERARGRGARVYGELLGGAITTDASPDEGAALARALREALARAGWQPGDVDLVLAEGCGTRVCDRVEAQALAEVVGRAPVTVPKSMFGHLYGASAATELACGLLAMERGVVPPTINAAERDPECPVALVVAPERRRVRRFLVVSRAREGVNVVLAVGAAPAA